MRLLASLLFLFAPLASSGWTPMRIVVVTESGLFEPKIERKLQSALQWFRDAIQVNSTSSSLTGAESIDKLKQFFDAKMTVTVTGPAKAFTERFGSSRMQKVLNVAHLTVYALPEKEEMCNADTNLMASVEPITLKVADRPMMAAMTYCKRAFEETFNYYDLFRHEILHGLGYGTIDPVGKTVTAPSTEFYDWKTISGRSQKATRHFLHFGRNAVASVKKHFGCDSDDVHGVESDIEKKHLNEYIFGNELMTPWLDYSKNYFSDISADIIDATYNGDYQWYKVDRKFNAREASLYRMYKGFGCAFLLESCHVFLQKNSGKDTLPLCPGPLSPKQVLEPREFCIKNDDVEYPMVCGEQTSARLEIADNGVRDVNDDRHYLPEHRFCPFLSYYDQLPDAYNITKCGADGGR